MGLFGKFSLPFSFNKKSDLMLQAPSEVFATPYKTITTFELKVEKPKFNGDIANVDIKFFPLN